MEQQEQRAGARRQFVKGTVATIGGVVAGSYAKPSMRSLGVPSLLAAVSGYGDDPGGKDKDKDKEKDKGGKKK